MKKLILLFLISLSFVANSQQSWTDIITKDITYGQIITECEQYFDRTGRQRGSGYKQFLRWRFIMDARVSENEKIQNFSALNAKAYSEALQKSPSLRSNTGSW